jgi:hypothetical protein
MSRCRDVALSRCRAVALEAKAVIRGLAMLSVRERCAGAGRIHIAAVMLVCRDGHSYGNKKAPDLSGAGQKDGVLAAEWLAELLVVALLARIALEPQERFAIEHHEPGPSSWAVRAGRRGIATIHGADAARGKVLCPVEISSLAGRCLSGDKR